jgi:hypothetical protein
MHGQDARYQGSLGEHLASFLLQGWFDGAAVVQHSPDNGEDFTVEIPSRSYLQHDLGPLKIDFQIKTTRGFHVVKHRQLGDCVLAHVSRANVQRWISSERETYLLVIVLPEDYRRLAPVALVRQVRCYGLNVKTYWSSVLAGASHGLDGADVRVHVPVANAVNSATAALLFGAYWCKRLGSVLTLTLARQTGGADLLKFVQQFVAGNLTLVDDFDAIHDMLLRLTMLERYAVRFAFAKLDLALRGLNLMHVRNPRPVHVFATDALGEEIAAFLFFAPSVHWLRESARWSLRERRNAYTRTFQLPPDVRKMPLYHSLLVWHVVEFMQRLGMTVRLSTEPELSRQPEFFLIEDTGAVSRSFVRSSEDWRTELKQSRRDVRQTLDLARGTYDLPAFAGAAPAIFESLGLRELSESERRLPRRPRSLFPSHDWLLTYPSELFRHAEARA